MVVEPPNRIATAMNITTDFRRTVERGFSWAHSRAASGAKTDAKQTNKNLLLSESATVDTKPQLEIYADDVKCTHGATIGQLNEESIFYLRARGIGAGTARRMLIQAFAGEIIERIRHTPAREELGEVGVGTGWNRTLTSLRTHEGPRHHGSKERRAFSERSLRFALGWLCGNWSQGRCLTI